MSNRWITFDPKRSSFVNHQPGIRDINDISSFPVQLTCLIKNSSKIFYLSQGVCIYYL